MSTYTQLRNRAFLKVCAAIVAKNPKATIHQVVDQAIQQAPEGHLCSYDRASRVLHWLVNHPDVPLRADVQERWGELLAQVKEEMARTGAKFPDALNYVMFYRRPTSFHIPRRTALSLLKMAVDARIIQLKSV